MLDNNLTSRPAMTKQLLVQVALKRLKKGVNYSSRRSIKDI